MEKCKKCGNAYNISSLQKNRYVCPRCGFYFRIPAVDRIKQVVDRGSFIEWFDDVENKSGFYLTEEYKSILGSAKEKTGLREAVLCGEASIRGRRIAIAACETAFLMASMGWVVGEKIALLFEKATERKLPVFIFCASGGARMQEEIVSLMQMEKTAAAVERHSEKGLFYCSILTDPTMGGVTASFAMLADVVLAEPGATIGFAGRRVIEQTIGEIPPENFQTAEYQLQHGMLDGIVERKRLRQVILFMTIAHSYGKTNSESTQIQVKDIAHADFLQGRPDGLSQWHKVRNIRGVDYPSTLAYVSEIFDVFVDLKGDRLYGEDPSVVGGIALLDGRFVTVITQDRGQTMEEASERHFGMPMPEGYRKSLRLMKQAEKFHRPIILLVNTVGAYCGEDAENRGQSMAIAQNLYEMSKIKVPVLSIIVGQAGSGGALAFAVADEVWMFESAVYTILTPEGYASILWKDASRAPEAAEKMRMGATDLKTLGIIDWIVPNTEQPNGENYKGIAVGLKKDISDFIHRRSCMASNELVRQRQERFRRM